jgi:hypothetical protein
MSFSFCAMAAPRPNWVVMPRIWNCAPPKFDFV